jgi:hypothetical protein
MIGYLWWNLGNSIVDETSLVVDEASKLHPQPSHNTFSMDGCTGGVLGDINPSVAKGSKVRRIGWK